MNTISYLHRIGFLQVVKADMNTLIALQQQHLFKIPFENIDIQLSVPVRLEKEFLFHKIVEKNRGGYCYELNALFCELLQAIGFDAYLVSGKITKGKKTGPEYDHMTVLVKLENRLWLTDVGYGDFSLKPLLIENNCRQFDGRTYYSIKKYDQEYWAVGKLKSYDGRFHTEYIFSLKQRRLKEFEAIHLHKQHALESHFIKTFLCSRPTETGRISIINNRLIHTTGKQRAETHYENLSQTLKQYFDITLSEHDTHNFKYLRYEQFV